MSFLTVYFLACPLGSYLIWLLLESGSSYTIDFSIYWLSSRNGVFLFIPVPFVSRLVIIEVMRILMNKLNLTSRAMSVTNCNSSKQVKHSNKTNAQYSYLPSTTGSEVRHHTASNIHKQQQYITIIYEILELHFPQLAATLTRKSMVGLGVEEVLGRIMRDLKQSTQNQVRGMEEEYRNCEIEILVLRDTRDQALEKNKALEAELSALSQRVKSKQLDSYSKNQQIFNLKQKLQQMQKCLVVKNIEVKNLYQQWQHYKDEASRQLQKQTMAIQKLRVENKRLHAQIQGYSHKVNQLEADVEVLQMESQINDRDREADNEKRLNLQRKAPKISYLQPYSQQHRHQKLLPRSRSFSVSNRKHNGSRVLEKPSTSELLDEVKELRENQSALLDRLAERDKLIESLENSVSHASDN